MDPEKEPAWVDGLNSAGRIHRYGYFDADKNRQALYSTVTIRPNSHGFAFRIDEANRRVWMQFNGTDIGNWTFEVLEKRLREKHSEAVFVAARSRGSGRDEEFHYRTVVYCANPSVDSFVTLIERGDVMLELRMHIKENGSARNHGSAFRIKQNRIPELYATTIQCRPK